MVRLGPDHPPVLLTVLSTEEEFDWDRRPFDRSATSVRAALHIERAQRVFDEFGVRPAYVVDHPIATQEESAAPLREIHRSGRCEIGAHLHPWVTPPLEEELSEGNSFPGSLEPGLEERKLQALARAIEESFGERPRTYQAGRYGLGPRTAELLERTGFEVDVSASPAFDYSPEGGPDYSSWTCDPIWFGRRRPLLAVPVTGAYVGYWRWGATRLHAWARGPLAVRARIPGVLSRIGALERLRLSPEDYGHGDNRRLTEFLLRRGCRVFVFGFHSPSLLPGCTPYVRSEADLLSFLDRCRRYFDYFLGELGGRAATPLELRRELLRLAPPPAPAP